MISSSCTFSHTGEADKDDQALPLPWLAGGRHSSRGKRHDRHHCLSAETTAAVWEPSYRCTLQVFKHIVEPFIVIICTDIGAFACSQSLDFYILTVATCMTSYVTSIFTSIPISEAVWKWLYSKTTEQTSPSIKFVNLLTSASPPPISNISVSKNGAAPFTPKCHQL